MVEHAKFKIIHLCEHCNKEFELLVTDREDMAGVTIAQESCPHCKKVNNLWISIPGESYRSK
jgi:hypothetical protein